MSIPAPSYSVGTATPMIPISPSSRQISSGWRCVRSSSAAIGLICDSEYFRTISRTIFCSSVGAKFIGNLLRVSFYLPVNAGFFFSKKAFIPSFWSSVLKHRARHSASRRERIASNNGILEGLNSLVQAANAKARGYRTFKNLKTIIYMLTGKLDYTKVGLPT